MDFDTDKYDLFNAPQYVDFNEFVRNDGFRNDNADDFFETHREEDDFFPAETSPSSQLVLKSSESDIQIILLQEPPKSVPVPAPASPEVSSTQSEDKPKYHPSECYPGGTGPTMSMFIPASPAVTPRPATSGLSESNKSNLALGNESDRGTQYYYKHQQSTTTTYQESHSHYVDSEDTENDENSQPESDMGIGEREKQEQGYKKKWPIKLTSSEEVIMKEESMKTLNTTILEKTRRIAELEQLEKARIKAELEKAEKLRIQAELEKSEKLRLKLEQERAEHARIEAETARLEKIRIQAELERIERARMEAEEKAEKARLEADIERQEKARIQAELEKLESIRRQAEKFELEMEKQQRFQQQQLEVEAEKAADDIDVDVDVGTMSLTTARTVDVQTKLDSKCLGDNLKNNDKYEYEINQNLTEDEDDPQVRTQNQALNQQYQGPEMKKHYSYDQYEHTAHPDYSKYSNFSTPHSHDPHFQLPILGSGAAGAQRVHGYPPKVMIKEPMMLLSKRTYNKVTIPQPFKFAESRPRKVQEAEVDNFKFRARPAPLKALHGGPPSNCQIQKSYKPKTTQPSEFHFASEDRIRERQLKRISQPNPLAKKEPSPGPGPGMGRKSRIGRVSVQHPHYNGSGSPKKEQYQSSETVGSSASGGDMTIVSGSGSVATTMSTVMGMGGMLRKPRIRTRSSSVDSNHRGFSPSTVTNMKPFSFEERDRETLKKKEEKIRNAIRAEIPIRNFHAQRVPNYSLSLKRLPKKKPAPPTCPEPFHFKCDQRGSAYQEEIQKKSQEEYMKLKQQSEFVAQPNEVIYKRPYEPERSAVPLVEPLDIVMNSDRRAEDRAKFDTMIKEKEAELDELRKQDKLLKQEQEVKLSNTLRQMCVHHAKPAPKSRIFEVKSSDKPLTEPKSPAFELLPSQRRPRNYENKENAK